MKRVIISATASMTWCMLAFSFPAWSANVQISPTSLDIKPGTVYQIQVSNVGSDSVVMESIPMEWSQQDNKDVLAPSSDLIAFPPVANAKPGETVIFRVGLRTPNNLKNYRLLLKELKTGSTEKAQIQMTYSLPVFTDSDGLIKIEAQKNPGKQGVVEIKNAGTKRAKITAVQINDSPKHSVLFYILPGATRNFEVPASGKNIKLYGEDGLIFAAGI